jgi:hypothetical protein
VLGDDPRELVQVFRFDHVEVALAREELLDACPQTGKRVSHEHCGFASWFLLGGVSRAALPQIVPLMSIRP